jgi:ribonucleoside-diphosphate reductase alpha chain
MPSERESITHRFKIGTGSAGGLKGYLTVGLLGNGRPGEVFVTLKKTGSLERGLCHILAVIISVALQYGVPLEKIVEKLTDVSFEPSGFTTNPDIPYARSVVDYIGKWLSHRFLKVEGTQTPGEGQERSHGSGRGQEKGAL